MESNIVHGLTGKYHNHEPFQRRRTLCKILSINQFPTTHSQLRPNQSQQESAKQFGINMTSLEPPGTLTQLQTELSSSSSLPILSMPANSFRKSSSGSDKNFNGNNKNPSDEEYDEDEDDPDDVFSLSQRMMQYLNPDISIDVKSEPISDDDD